MDLHNVSARVNRLNVPDGEVPSKNPVHRQVSGHEEGHDEGDGVDHQAGKGLAQNPKRTHVTGHDQGAVVHAHTLESYGVEANRVDQANRGARVNVDVAQHVVNHPGMHQMWLAARGRREASHVGRQETHRHSGDGGREHRPERGQLLDRAGVGQIWVSPKPRRREDRRSRSTSKVRNALQKFHSRGTASWKNRERRVGRLTERLRIIEERRVKKALGTHQRRVRQRPETRQVKGTDRRLAGVPAQDSRGRADRAYAESRLRWRTRRRRRRRRGTRPLADPRGGQSVVRVDQVPQLAVEPAVQAW